MRSWSNHWKKKDKATKIRFPFLQLVIPRMQSRVCVGEAKQTSHLKFHMGITGVPSGRTEVFVPPNKTREGALSRGRVPGGLARMVIGKMRRRSLFV